ncbi:hypothetical protein AB205_0135020 [Aquarana catesbeiana]|uniref:Uncharacterized protein n=1 Tax=Aquarana catesbeiana TaxID=8400 RepID=A0A2G9SLU6_AQUCT|nr:hypothetical protein AB205_0135020 [Aquarana catesbeiana]
MKDATMLMSEERNPTVSLIAPLNAQLLQSMTDTMGDTPMMISRMPSEQISRRGTAVRQRTRSFIQPLHWILALRDCLLSSQRRRDGKYTGGVTEEAASLEITANKRAHEDQVPRRKGTLEEEEESSPIEDNHPPAPFKRKARSLLMTLLEESFT